MSEEEGEWLLQVSARAPGAATSAAVDFLIPGVEGLHFVAYGGQGSLVVAYAGQLDSIGASCQENAEQQQQQLQTVLVVHLQQPSATATVVGLEAAPGAAGGLAPTTHPPLLDPVVHVAFGGGPHLLLAACTTDTLVVVSLEGLAAQLFRQQTSVGSAEPHVPQQLWRQVAGVHSGHAELLAVSWTQQLDGLLSSSSDGTLTMWQLQPLVPTQDTPLPPGMADAVPVPDAVLRAAWSVNAPIPQRLVCAGVSVYAPSATAVGRGSPAAAPAKASSGGAARGDQSGGSPALSSCVGSSPSIPAKEMGEGQRYVSVWWPQIREQRQRHYAAGMPSVGQEKLRHPAAVTGLQWSPGVLQKDALSLATAGRAAAASAAPMAVGVGSPGTGTGTGTSDPGSPTWAAAAAGGPETEDHPALLTLTEDGVVRVWVETLVLTESGSPQTPHPTTQPGGDAQPRSQLHRVSPTRTPGSGSKRGTGSGAGSPGAAPSSPRDVRRAAAAAAALGAAAPAITSYFCMALLINPPTSAQGMTPAATSAVAAVAKPGVQHPGQQHAAMWGRHVGFLLNKQQRRVAAPVLWLLTATLTEEDAAAGKGHLLLHLHAVRGLSPIVMSAGYGGSLSTTSGGSKNTRPAAVVWGQHSWELPASAVGGVGGLSLLLRRLSCWVSDEGGFPLLHVATTSSGAARGDFASGSGRLVLAGRSFATVHEDGSMSMLVHKQLAVVCSVHAAAAAHTQAVTALAVAPRGPDSLVASCDRSGRLLLWTGPHLQHLAAVPAAAAGSSAALAWLMLEAAPVVADAGNVQGWLGVGSGSLLQCYSISHGQVAAVATAALPAGCSVIKSLLPLKNSDTSDGGDSNKCLLVAVCSNSTGRGSRLCAWQCSTAPSGRSNGSGRLQLQVAPACTAPVPAVTTAVMAAATGGGSRLLLGTADSRVLLLRVVAESTNLLVQPLASIQEEQGPIGAVSASEDCAWIATTTPTGISVWTAGLESGNSVTGSSGVDAPQDGCYRRVACLSVPPSEGHATAVAWLPDCLVPCLSVASSSGSMRLLAPVRRAGSSSSAWHWVARLPASAAGGGTQIRQLVAGGGGCSMVVAAAGSQLLRLSESMQLHPGVAAHHQLGSAGTSLGRFLLDNAGPLPQYHPRFLAALLLSGRLAAAAAVLERLADWLAGVKQLSQAASVVEQAGLPHLAPPGTQGTSSGTVAEGSADLAVPRFPGLALADIVDPRLMQALLVPRSTSPTAPNTAHPSACEPHLGTTSAGLPNQLATAPMQQPQQQVVSSSLESGMLDLSAFGMSAPPATAPAQLQQQPASSSLESGMLDLASFGMGGPPAPAPAEPQQPAGSSLDSGMLDLASFGMAAPPAAAAAQQQQQPADTSLECGMLDLASFGMETPPTAVPAQQQQPTGSSLESGMLDLASFGMAAPPAASPDQQGAQRFLQSAMSSASARAAGPEKPGAVKQPHGVLLPHPNQQQRFRREQLLPVPVECLAKLQELLAGQGSSSGSGNMEDAAAYGTTVSSTRLGDAALHAAGAGISQTAPATATVTAIPGLSLAATVEVLSIAEAFTDRAAASSSSGAGSNTSEGEGGLMDAAAAHFLAAVRLACVASGREQCPGSSGSNNKSAPESHQAQQPRTAVMNAAGVAYTLAPTAVAGSEDSAAGGAASSITQEWGLLPGLDAMAVLWALLSGSEEAMLQEALHRLHQREAALAAAAAATESVDAAFLAVQAAASKPAQQQAPTWARLRQLGAGFWLHDLHLLLSTAEQLAKQQFATRRNADDCALLYSALGKRSVLQGLYRSTQNRKLADFLARDFGQEQNRQAAQKNAFVLLGQHRCELAAAFFILGDCPEEAVGVAANEMRDPQLALILCRLLFGSTGGKAELRLLQQLQHAAETSTCGDAAVAAAACCWLQGDAAAMHSLLLDVKRPGTVAANSEHAAQLLPLLHLALQVRPRLGSGELEGQHRQLRGCLQAMAATLQGSGLHALAVEAAAAAVVQAGSSSSSNEAPSGQQAQSQQLLHQVVAMALLPGVLEPGGPQQLEAAAAQRQIELLQHQGVPLDVPAVLSHLRRLSRSLLPQRGPHSAGGWALPTAGLARPGLERQASSGASSYRSRDVEQPRWQQQRHGGGAVVDEGQVMFRVDGDKLEAVDCCPLMSPDVLGRSVVVASQRQGLVEGQLQVLPQPRSLLPEAPDSPAAVGGAVPDEEQQQRGGMFGRLLSQLFDEASWHSDPTWHGTAEFDVVGGAAGSAGAAAVVASSTSTAAIATHPHKQLFLTGCSSGRVHLWRFQGQHAVAAYTPVPGSELASISTTFNGLLSFSRSFRQSPMAPKLANWGKAAAVRFAPGGERFAAVGEGGVVALWRTDAPSRVADADGSGCAEWWHQALSKQGCAVDFVGGSSSVLVVGGRCQAGGTCSNLSVFDTMAPTAASCVGRLSHHQSTVTAVCTLPGGWLLGAGDSEGGLSCSDLRMISTAGPRVLWSVKAARGSVRSIVALPSSAAHSGLPPLGSSGPLLATAGADGAVRVWKGADGRLLQSIDGAHHSSRPGSAGSRRPSSDGGYPLTPTSGHMPRGTQPLPVTGLAVCEEGLVSCGADGCVRLFSFIS